MRFFCTFCLVEIWGPPIDACTPCNYIHNNMCCNITEDQILPSFTRVSIWMNGTDISGVLPDWHQCNWVQNLAFSDVTAHIIIYIATVNITCYIAKCICVFTRWMLWRLAFMPCVVRQIVMIHLGYCPSPVIMVYITSIIFLITID